MRSLLTELADERYSREDLRQDLLEGEGVVGAKDDGADAHSKEEKGRRENRRQKNNPNVQR